MGSLYLTPELLPVVASVEESSGPFVSDASGWFC